MQTSLQTPPLDATAMHSTRVRDAMHPGIVACTPTATAAEVAQVMATCRVHCVLIVAAEGDGHPAISGVVSDLDLVSWATSGRAHLSAGAVASAPAGSIGPGASVYEAAQAMAQRGATHLVVVDPRRHVPLGIISALDVAMVLGRSTTIASPATDAA